MSESEKKAYDPYDFSEIENIQREIERDLNSAPPQAEPAELSDGALAPDESALPVYTPPSVSDAPEALAETIDGIPEAPEVTAEEAETPPVSADHSTFYHETIKHGPPPAGKLYSWKKTVAVICLVCTLGTGTLGVGIGAAVTWTRHIISGGAGINGGAIGNDANAAGYGIVSTRTVFDSDTPRDGTYSDVIKLVEPSVVGVSSTFESTGGADILGGGQANTGEASGIIFWEDDQRVYIATNSHVVSGAVSVAVTFAEGGAVPARPVGSNVDADLAVISVDKKDLNEAGITSIVIAVFGDSDKMEMGDQVLTIGNALGEGNSSTQGIISAKEKTIPIQNRNLTVLQTDAAINFGNSGGPLINLYGEVIGINTAKLTSSYYGVEGIGYSISTNAAKPILEGLIADATAGPKPMLGIRGATLTEETAEMYGLPAIGVLVDSVTADSGAEKAGIVRYDIITSFNGSAVFTIDQLVAEVQKCEVGDTVEVKLIREGTTPTTVNVTLGDDENNF